MTTLISILEQTQLMAHLPYFVLFALIAEILGTVGGFGSSVFFVPFAAYFLDFHSILGITAVFHVSSNLSKILLFKKGFDKKLVIKMGIPAVMFVILGAYLSQFIKTNALEGMMAVFLIVTSATFLFKKKLSVPPNNTNAIGGGMISGLIAGLIGTGGSIRGIVLTAFNLTTESFIVTSAIIDLGIDFSRSLVYINNGFVHVHDLYLVPILLVVSFIGTWIGKKILNHFTKEQFRTTVLVLIMITGISSLVRIF